VDCSARHSDRVSNSLVGARANCARLGLRKKRHPPIVV
jgi:hypothetical protein